MHISTACHRPNWSSTRETTGRGLKGLKRTRAQKTEYGTQRTTGYTMRLNFPPRHRDVEGFSVRTVTVSFGAGPGCGPLRGLSGGWHPPSEIEIRALGGAVARAQRARTCKQGAGEWVRRSRARAPGALSRLAWTLRYHPKSPPLLIPAPTVGCTCRLTY